MRRTKAREVPEWIGHSILFKTEKNGFLPANELLANLTSSGICGKLFQIDYAAVSTRCFVLEENSPTSLPVLD
jgi:hypothetical protein